MASQVQTRDGLYGFEFRDVDRRRVPEDERKTYEAKALWQRHHEIVNLAARGYKQVEIARILNIDPQTVSNILNSQLGKYKLSEIRQERDEETKLIVEKVRVLTEQALNIYQKIFDNENGAATIKDQKDVADTVVLELSGLRVPTRIQSNSVSTVLSAAELEEFKQRGIRAARESGLVIDVISEAKPVKFNGNGSEPQADKANGDAELRVED